MGTSNYEFIRAGSAAMWFLIAAIAGVVWIVTSIFSKISEAKQNKKDAAQEEDYLNRIKELTNDKRYEDLFLTMIYIIKTCSLKGDKFNHLEYYVQNLKFACAGLGRPVRKSFFDELLNNSLQVAKDFREMATNMEEWRTNGNAADFEVWLTNLTQRAETFSSSMDEELSITDFEKGDPVGWKMKNYQFTYQNLAGEVVEKIIGIPDMDD
jgi:hypothetical protein